MASTHYTGEFDITPCHQVSLSSPVSLPPMRRHDVWRIGGTLRDTWSTDARCVDVLPGGIPLVRYGWVGTVVLRSRGHLERFQVTDKEGYCACHHAHHASGRYVVRLLERLRGSTLITNVPNGEPLGESVYTGLTYTGKSEPKVEESDKVHVGVGSRCRESVNKRTRKKRRNGREVHRASPGSLLLLSRHALTSKFLKPFSPLLNRYEHTIGSRIACRQSSL